MHSKFQGEKRDKFTFLTFLFLAISQLFLCTNLVLQLYQDLYDSLWPGHDISLK
jgi:hypothetical protein